MARRSLPPQARSRGVTAVLGPTNTGKTHLALERMLGHDTGMIGLPLRLLAREVYGRVVARAGAEQVALVTGEEKIKPRNPRYWISTVEAMPRDLDLSFVAIDEIQLAADLDRGHTFTDRLLHQRGRAETLLIGSSTMRPLVEALVPGVHVVTRPRLSKLSFAGEKKISRLPPRTAIVAFSAEEVYAIAELIRRQRGGAAVVLGALSPRTRNAQVDLYQNGDVDYLVATDAVGMGLNLDVDHVAFAADRKFDGFRFRRLTNSELGQIAGRAGRHLSDGTFGTTGRCSPFEPEVVEALEDHVFEPHRVLQWRNPDLRFHSLHALQESLAEVPGEAGLTRAPTGEDVTALEIVARESEVRELARGREAVERLWDVCQVPDYRKISPAGHADLVSQIYRFLMTGMAGRIPADWFARHVAALDRTEGDIDTLSNRIAQVRTWTFVANRPDWLADPEHWQAEARRVEDRLSDALHERLATRFVDRRTSVLMRRLRENAMLEAEITAGGDVTVEGQHVGHLHGFHFVPDPATEGATEAKALRNAAERALAGEIEARAERFANAPDATIVLSNDGTIRWTGDPVARLLPGDKLFEPRIRLVADEQLTGPARDRVEGRLTAWVKAHVARLLGPVVGLETAADLTGIARGIAFQIGEALGVLERARVVSEVRGLDQAGRAALRSHGVRFGAYHLYLPALLKPAPRTLAAQLWALRNGGLDQRGLDDLAHLAGSGRTSMPVDPEIAKGLYRAAGFRVCGGRAVRVDILERLADLIRPAIAYRPGTTPGEPPPGAADGEGFVQTPAMTSLVGCSGEDFGSILKSLGYVLDRRPGPAITVPLAPAPTAPVPSGGAGDEGTASAAGEANPDEVASGEPEVAAQAVSADETVPGAGFDLAEAAAADPDLAADLTLVEVGAPEQDVEEPSAEEPDAEQAMGESHEPHELVDDATDEAVAADAIPEARADAAGTPDGVEATAPDATAPEGGVPETHETVDAVPGDEAPAEAAPVPSEDIADGMTPPEMAAEAVADEVSEAPEPDAAAEASGADASTDAPAETSAETSAEISAEAAGAPAEPVLIEVWRLHRHHRDGARPNRGARDGRPRDRHGDRRGGDRHGDRHDGGRRGGERRPGAPPAGPGPESAEVAAGASPQGEAASRDGRPAGRGGRWEGRGGQERGGQGRGGQGRGDGHPRGEGRGERRGNGRGQGQGPGQNPGEERGGFRPGRDHGRDERREGPRPSYGGPSGAERRDRRDRAPDPDSPFAKLLALKAQLESRDGGKR